ncbi:chromosomal replication initiator protein DnaA [Candidatus Gracilibacteria bacterium]|nr:chromosomal replication initiator protein DnaA [Candidatus Gracilibacteria bacterium]
MLIDIVENYDQEKKNFLVDIREKAILQLSSKYDHKKLFSFLNKTGIVNIDESEKTVYIGVPNEFVLSQIKKFLAKGIKESIHTVYNPQFEVKFSIYPPFSNGSDLLINLKKLLKITETNKSDSHQIQENVKNDFKEYIGILFDPNFSFDNFIIGSNNNFAFSAAKAVSENPGITYNPLFIYGNVGLGKTHLMQAIGNEIIQSFPEKVAVYLPCTKLIDEIIEGIKKNKLSNMMKKFDDVDVLLIDDVQFLAGKDKTQEIFYNIFNDFHSKKKQVILTSDRPPKELTQIEPRLKSRFGFGLVADIQSPDFETRIAILQAKLDIKQEYIDFELLSLIAKYIKTNVRELEGALNILITRKKLSGNGELTENDVLACLKTLGYSTQEGIEQDKQEISDSNVKGVDSFGKLVEMVAQYYNIGVNEIKSDSRRKEITNARQILMLIGKKHFGWTLEKIGDFLGGKNHASVIYAITNIEKKLKSDGDISHDYNIFMDWIEK